MALTPLNSLCFKNNCKTIRINDITGVYDVVTNIGGWGTPNTTLVQADPVTITLTLPDNTSSIFTVTSTVNAATISGGQFHLIDIETTDITGFSESQFEDGIYNIIYLVTDSSNGTEYTYETNIWNDCKVKCCLAKSLTRVEKELCGCEFTEFWHQYNLISMNLASARYAFGNGDFTNAKKYLKAMQKSCKILSCQC